MSEELEKLRHKQYVAERKLTAAKHKEKRLQSELKRLTRSERTHRLCTRAGMLETFLKEPTVLTDEDVMELLTFIFQSEAVQKKLNLLIESRRETQEADEGAGKMQRIFRRTWDVKQSTVSTLPKIAARRFLMASIIRNWERS